MALASPHDMLNVEGRCAEAGAMTKSEAISIATRMVFSYCVPPCIFERPYQEVSSRRRSCKRHFQQVDKDPAGLLLELVLSALFAVSLSGSL